MKIEPIAKIYTDYSSKFGIPRQPGLVPNSIGKIVFEHKYRSRDSVRGLDGFSHIWLIWQFSENVGKPYSPTVRPPRLGGNVRMGVFATRSPFRPNNLGLSCVRIKEIDLESDIGPIIYVFGADIMDGTPIYDIKPYIPYSDSIPDAHDGFASSPLQRLPVIFCDGCDLGIDSDMLANLEATLSLDPRPHYQSDDRQYGMIYADKEIKFRVIDGTLYVLSILAK